MSNGGKITIETANCYFDSDYVISYPWAEMGDYVLLSVSDTGAGIPPEIRDRIFEPFFTTKEVGEGTGLGLATVYAITKRHKGGINIYSEPGHGVTFQIYFPAAQDTNKIRSEKRSYSEPRGGTETILLAEDDDAVRNLAVSILNMAGYRVIVARDGEEAIQLFQQNQDGIDLALLDAIMPKKNGQVVYDFIRMHRSKMPVMFSTGYGFNVLKNIYLPDDGVQLIGKPYGPRELLQKVREALDTRQS
jgi:polar amino acid transport system substrate-binding protein